MPKSEESCLAPQKSEVVRGTYRLLFEMDPPSCMLDWIVAKLILMDWDGRKLNQDPSLVRQFIFGVVLDIEFPQSFEDFVRKTWVGLAEELGKEFFPEIGDHDPSMDVYESLYFAELQRSTIPA